MGSIFSRHTYANPLFTARYPQVAKLEPRLESASGSALLAICGTAEVRSATAVILRHYYNMTAALLQQNCGTATAVLLQQYCTTAITAAAWHVVLGGCRSAKAAVRGCHGILR